jgi:hypothetical protein
VARSVCCRSSAARLPPVSSRNRWSSRACSSASDIERSRAAASSIASGRPSSCRHTDTTSRPADASRTPRSMPCALARLVNSATASLSAAAAGSSSPAAGRESDGTRYMTSPAIPSGSRLVAIRCTRAQCRNNASATFAQAPIRCSQLSTTISMFCGASASASTSSIGRPGCATIRNASHTAQATSSSLVSPASSTSHTPSPDPSSRSAATCKLSRVLPHPPAPVSVTRREAPTKDRTSASSRSRPMNGVSWAGRLFSSAGLPSDRSGGNSDRSSAAHSWKIRSGCPRSFSRCRPRSASATPVGSPPRVSTAAASDTSTCPP